MQADYADIVARQCESSAECSSNSDSKRCQAGHSVHSLALECAEFTGILTEEITAKGLSNLHWTADGTAQVYFRLALSGLQLIDISVLTSYIHVQEVDISHNKISDLSALGGMTSLLQLDASYNALTKLLDFTPPNCLKIVKMSHNQITEMTDLSAHQYLQHLDLDHNEITEIRGLSSCRRLKYLSLSNNKIDRIQGLDCLPLKFLSLNRNELKKIENLETLIYLQKLELANNKIRSMDGLQGHKYLEVINLEENEILDLAEVTRVASNDLLRSLNMRGNPLCELPDYRLSVIFSLQQLTELDTQHIDVAEKVAARNLFSPSLEYLAARDHMMHVVYSFLQPTRLLDITLPVLEMPYPMLVLVGPQGLGKKSLAQKLAEDLPDYFGYAASHTTRSRYADEVAGRDYHFISLDEFDRGIKLGAFLQMCSYHSELYGLSLEAVEIVARESLACVVHMELEGALTLKNTYLEPRYVLVVSETRDGHERRLLEKGVYTAEQVQLTLNRAQFYARFNGEHPGFFDTVVSSDDISEMYVKLRSLVLEYLGIPPTPNKQPPSVVDASVNHVLRFPERRGQSAPEPTRRSWSRPSITDSCEMTRSNIHGPGPPATLQTKTLPTARSTMESESIRRRQSAVKDSLLGRSIQTDAQLRSRFRCTATAVTPSTAGREKAADRAWYSAPVTAGVESSTHSDTSCSTVVDPSLTAEPVMSDLSTVVRRRLGDETVLDLTTPTTIHCRSTEQLDSPPSPSHDTVPDPATSRPGSGRHPVLPPIRGVTSIDTDLATLGADVAADQ